MAKIDELQEAYKQHDLARDRYRALENEAKHATGYFGFWFTGGSMGPVLHIQQSGGPEERRHDRRCAERLRDYLIKHLGKHHDKLREGPLSNAKRWIWLGFREALDCLICQDLRGDETPEMRQGLAETLEAEGANLLLDTPDSVWQQTFDQLYRETNGKEV